MRAITPNRGSTKRNNLPFSGKELFDPIPEESKESLGTIQQGYTEFFSWGSD
jgi:hypothetical protein